VLLDVRWGNDVVSSESPEAVLQIGFSTASANDRRQLPPVNLSLVIDKSGSMADADKLSRVKEALLTLVSQLRETDVLSIVVFDSEAQVLLPAPTRRRGLVQARQHESGAHAGRAVALQGHAQG
jgi:Ca-activated chloride channel family protein